MDQQFQYVSREEWGALPPTGPIEELKKPIVLIFFHTTKTRNCNTSEHCLRSIKQLQKVDMEEGFPDIIYNFLVGGDFKVYEGRGFNGIGIPFEDEGEVDRTQQKLDIAYIGDFRGRPDQIPPLKAINAAEAFIDYWKDKKVIKRKCEERWTDDNNDVTEDEADMWNDYVDQTLNPR